MRVDIILLQNLSKFNLYQLIYLFAVIGFCCQLYVILCLLECDCDIGGSIDNNCDKQTGQCRCHSRVEGRRCDRPIRAHFFPTLHQFQFEVEEGYTQSGPVRYRNSDEVFPGYSWKGYVVFSMLQVCKMCNLVNILNTVNTNEFYIGCSELLFFSILVI